MVVRRNGSEDLPGKEESGADIQMVDELVVDSESERAAGAIAGDRVDGCVVGAAHDAEC